MRLKTQSAQDSELPLGSIRDMLYIYIYILKMQVNASGCWTHRMITGNIRVRLEQRHDCTYKSQQTNFYPQKLTLRTVLGLQGERHQRPYVAVRVYSEGGEGDQRQVQREYEAMASRGEYIANGKYRAI